jgi:hypothetical protein
MSSGNPIDDTIILSGIDSGIDWGIDWDDLDLFSTVIVPAPPFNRQLHRDRLHNLREKLVALGVATLDWDGCLAVKN